MPSLPPLEIQALAKILDELDYYQVLHLESDCTQSEVKQAYFRTSRTFHPDANRGLDPELLQQIATISKRVTEAYCVLRDPRRRQAYDAQRADEGGTVRIQLAEARASHARQDAAERQGRTAQGRQFHQKAAQCLDRGDASGAVGHLQMALTFEPDNAWFKELLEEAKAARD